MMSPEYSFLERRTEKKVIVISKDIISTQQYLYSKSNKQKHINNLMNKNFQILKHSLYSSCSRLLVNMLQFKSVFSSFSDEIV
jgi:hypothetical protein